MVSLNVFGEFLLPESGPSLRCIRMPAVEMSMPEAAVHKNDGPQASEHYIGLTRETTMM